MHNITEFLHKLHDAKGLEEIIAWGGFVILASIVFAETGLLVGFFLPGDSLLFVAGFLVGTSVLKAPSPLPEDPISSFVALNCVLMLAAFIGNSTGYWVGSKAGPRLFNRPDSRLFKRDHLIKTREFYERHGAKTIVLAEFMPFARTFAPVVAGISQLSYRRFMAFNALGVVIWVSLMTTLGYVLGNASFNIGDKEISVRDHLDKAIIFIVLLSVLPAVLHLLKKQVKKTA